MVNADLVEIDLTCWCEHYPTGAIIHFVDGTEEGEFCDTVEEYKEFLSMYRDRFSRYGTEFIVKINMMDIGTSNVIEAAKEIDEFIQQIREELK